MNPSLVIQVGDHETLIQYSIDGHRLVSHMHPYGLKHIEADGMNQIAGSKLQDGIIYALEFVSLHDRIPTQFRLISPRYATWIGETLEGGSYTQFYTGGVPINVTLEGTYDPSFGYARHTQTIHSFKV
jgi:hypothetical protein